MDDLPVESLVTIGVSLSIIIITTLILVCICVRRTANKGRVVCLLGLSNSGKTLLYMRMTNGDYVRTQTSIKENKTTYSVTNKKGSPIDIELVDVPGDERIRQRSLEQYINKLMGVVILIDSVNFSKEIRDLCHVIIDLLSDTRVHKRRVPVLIACNKQDLSLATPLSEIKESLENEITQILTSQSVKLSSIDSSKERKTVTLVHGGDDGRFTFDDQSTHRIQLVTCSARGKGDENSCEPEIDDITNWINKLVS